MQNGDEVRIYPADRPDLASVGTLLMISGNQCSAAVVFDEKPGFLHGLFQLAVHVKTGQVILLLTRRFADAPDWWDVSGPGRYRMQPLAREFSLAS